MEPKPIHVMLDLETMGTGNDAAIVAIGAVKFNPLTEDPMENFYVAVDLSSSMKCGGKADGSTIMWWLEQSVEARMALKSAPIDLPTALDGFALWYGQDPTVPLWGNASTFDNVILRSAYDRLGLRAPWSFRSDVCMRTLKYLYPHVEMPPREGVHHNALDDAIWQAKYTRWMFASHKV